MHSEARCRKRRVTCGSGSEKVGRMQDSSHILGDMSAIRRRMERDGYLFLRGFLPRKKVLETRRTILELARIPSDAIRRVSDEYRPLEVLIHKTPSLRLLDRQDIASHPKVLELLEHPRIVKFFESFFQEGVVTTRYKWLRSVGKGEYTGVHIDRVYLGGGSRRLITMWVPMGDIPMRHGTLLVSRGSHKAVSRLIESQDEEENKESPRRFVKRRKTGEKKWRGVDGREDGNTKVSKAGEYVLGTTGKQGNRTSSGWIATEPSKVPKDFLSEPGGEWVSADFKAGDVAIVLLESVHMSTSNSSDFWRLSCDTRWQPSKDARDPLLVFQEPSRASPATRACVAAI